MVTENGNSALRDASPVFIGAVGGSGTRVVARLVRRAGFHLGSNLNVVEDAMEFFDFHERWIDRYLAAELLGDALPADELAQMRSEFRAATQRHIRPLTSSDAANARWAWKAPRGILLLPFLHAEFPRLRFVHVVRDGRDIAFADNLSQLDKHSAHILTARERWCARRPERAISFWERVNLRAAVYAEKNLGTNYHLLRLEDLCHRPIETTDALFAFLGTNENASAASAEVTAPPTIGRWRTRGERLIADLHRAGAVALRKFGYVGAAAGWILGSMCDFDCGINGFL